MGREDHVPEAASLAEKCIRPEHVTAGCPLQHLPTGKHIIPSTLYHTHTHTNTHYPTPTHPIKCIYTIHIYIHTYIHTYSIPCIHHTVTRVRINCHIRQCYGNLSELPTLTTSHISQATTREKRKERQTDRDKKRERQTDRNKERERERLTKPETDYAHDHDTPTCVIAHPLVCNMVLPTELFLTLSTIYFPRQCCTHMPTDLLLAFSALVRTLTLTVEW